MTGMCVARETARVNSQSPLIPPNAPNLSIADLTTSFNGSESVAIGNNPGSGSLGGLGGAV